MIESKLGKFLCFDSFQYGAGDIAIPVKTGDLHLYEVVDTVSVSGNFAKKNLRFRKDNNFLNIYRANK
jgi:hypothetical protein